MIHSKRFHGNVFVFVDNAGLNLVNIDFIADLIGMLRTFRSTLNVRLKCLQEMVCHGRGSRRTIDLEGLASSHDPWRKHDISKPERVVGMQMGDESDLEIRWFQSFDPFVASCRGAPDDSGSKIKHIWSTVDHDGRAGA